MSYCVNPDCPKPQNLETNLLCQGCGFNLCLHDRYRAIKLIAQGGFSRTFLAIDEGQSPASACVLKQLWTKHLTSEASTKAIDLFEQEILQLEQLGKHPQIPTLLGHFEQNQYLYLVQEFIDGTNLAKVVQEEGLFTETQIWQLLDDLLPVLKFIHNHQIIHRDIKPENIIRRACPYQGEARAYFQTSPSDSDPPKSPFLRGTLTEFSPLKKGGWGGSPGLKTNPTGGEFVLVDFGAVKLVTGAEALKAGTRIGSPEYAAPEQAKGKAVFASDLYSLGVSCLYLLTGIPPFDLFDVVNDSWAWRDYLTQDVSTGLADILDKLVQNAIAYRFQSVDGVVQAINQARVQRRRGERETFVPTQTDKPITPVLSTQKWECIHTLASKSNVNSVAISSDGELLASGSDDKSIRLFNLDTGQVISTFTGHSQGIKSVTFNPDGTLLATGSDDRTVKLWNISQRQEIYTFSKHSHAVKSVAFSPKDNLIASGSWDKTIQLWNIETSVLERTLIGHSLQVAAVAFSPCGTFLASASFDRTVRLWELSSGLSSTLEGHSWAVFAIAFSPDGKTLATGSSDNTVILWDLETRKPLYTLLGHSWSVVAVTFSLDGETLISASWDKTIKLWQVSTGQEIATLTGHLDSIYGVAMSPNGQIIVSGSKDKTVKVWHRVK